MNERLKYVPPNPQRPYYKNIEHKAVKNKSTADHEIAHWAPIKSFGKSANVSVKPTSEYRGVTIPTGILSDKQMQVAAMGSADHSGNGSDKWKASQLESTTGMSMRSAAEVARKIHSSFGEKVLDIAATYLAVEENATDSRMSEFIIWAKEDLAAPVILMSELEDEEQLAA